MMKVAFALCSPAPLLPAARIRSRRPRHSPPRPLLWIPRPPPPLRPWITTRSPAEDESNVVSSKAMADKVQQGTHPQTAITKIGYGPNRETVVLREQPEGPHGGSTRLMADYATRHGKK